ncbi:MAG: hypothetical protein WBW13_24960, partial [Pseudolabrys sp.]
AVRRTAAAPARLLGWALWRFGLRVGSSIWTGGSCDAPGSAAGACCDVCALDEFPPATASAR